jgi:Phage integrase central domain
MAVAGGGSVTSSPVRSSSSALVRIPKSHWPRRERRARSFASRSRMGQTPSAERQQKKIARREAIANTYKSVALEWLEKTAKARQWSVDHSQRTQRRLEVHFFPWLGPKPIADVTDDDVMACLRRIEDRNLLDTAHRALSENDSVFRYAKKRKYVKHNVAAALRGPDTLPRVKVRKYVTCPSPRRARCWTLLLVSRPSALRTRAGIQP